MTRYSYEDVLGRMLLQSGGILQQQHEADSGGVSSNIMQY